jgi:hypothetical protein
MRLPRSPRIRELGSGTIRRLLGERAFTRLRSNWLAAEEFDLVCQARLAHLVMVNQPLVLISQIERSGGTLLSRLFDGHPQCHAHPYELKVGYPTKDVWPQLDLTQSPEAWYHMLWEHHTLRLFKSGYHKYAAGAGTEIPVYPFIVPSILQRAIFDHCIAGRPIASERDVLDCYMTSYFNAWLDNQNLYEPGKKFITAFTPRLNMKPDSLERFFTVYPDGWLISSIREPKSWYVSARKHSPELYSDMAEAIRLWQLSARAMLAAQERYGSRVYLLSFEALVGQPEETMTALARSLGLKFTPGLLRPTFNQMPIQADSSFPTGGYGISEEPLSRHAALLTAQESAYINDQACELYLEVVEHLDSPARRVEQ